MTHLLAILASTSAWIHKITPESSIVPYHSFSTSVFLRIYLSFLYKILSLLHQLQHWFEEYSADLAQMNTWKGSYAYDISLATASLAAASWFTRLSWLYVCPSRRYTTYSHSYFSLMDNKLSMTPCNSATTHRVLWHAVTSNARAVTHAYYV